MFILGLQLHWVTLSIVTLELLLFVGQAVGFLCRPQDKKLGWQLLLLILVILRNTVEGLFQTPNPSLWIPILWQNFFAHGFGYVVASYFPLYWYLNYWYLILGYLTAINLLIFDIWIFNCNHNQLGKDFFTLPKRF